VHRAVLVVGSGVITALAFGWFLFVKLPDMVGGGGDAANGPAGEAGAEPEPTISGRLFYVAPDGAELIAVERPVPLAEDTAEQARLLLEQQLLPPPAPLATAVPVGTTLRALYMTDRGEAYVDLSADVRNASGSREELLAVYTIVNALTVNLPAIESVQILVEGSEVDTLAGHIDLRNPLRQNLQWVRNSEADPSAPPADGASQTGTPEAGVDRQPGG